MSFRNFIEDYPVTSSILTVNFLIFTLNQFHLFPYPVSYPEIFNIGTFAAHFSHLNFWHIFMNMFVLIQISPILERPLGSLKYAGVVIFIWLITSVLIYPFLSAPTLGFSGIMLGLLTFTIGLYFRRKAFANELLMWLGINIVIGLHPAISFWGHLGGALSGAVIFGLYLFFGGRFE